MTQRGWNANADVPTFFDVRDVVRFALLAAVALAVVANVRAGDKTPRPFPGPTAFVHVGEDLNVASHVRAALRRDERLRPNVPLVNVTNGIAHLSGPLPSADLKRRAVEIAGQVDGVLKVESAELYVAKASRRPRPLSLPLEDDKPTRTRSASPSLLSDALSTLTARDAAPPSPTPPSPRRVTLMAPEAMALPPRPAEPARLTANPRSSSLVSSLPAALEHLRRSDVRFRAIRTEVRGTTVRVLTGTAAGENVMAFARRIRALPGVQRVIIQDTSPRSR